MTRTRSKGYSLRAICNYVGISRQAYYQAMETSSKKAIVYSRAEAVVVSNRKERSRAGLRTIWHKESLNSLLGLNQFEVQMSLRGFALKPYRSRIKTTDSRGHHHKFDNLISGTDVNGENQVIVGDITYYQNGKELYYIFHFLDYYTLEVKGLVGGTDMQGIHAEKCLRQVFGYNKKSAYKHQLIVHTDAGGQYRSTRFQKLLRDAGIRPSHARNCFENGLSERANGIVKNEYLVDYDIKSVTRLNAVLKKIKQDINEVWPSKVLGYKTPKQYAEMVRSMPKSKRPIKTVKVVE
jgi:transposase InsO family protein